jgi:hypothetical protein
VDNLSVKWKDNTKMDLRGIGCEGGLLDSSGPVVGSCERGNETTIS